MKKEKKIRVYDVDGCYVLSKKKKVKSLGKDFCIASVTSKDLERLATYAKQRKDYLEGRLTGLTGTYIVRLSPDLIFLIDDRKEK